MGKGKKILVVDADQAFRESIVNFLLACGVEQFELASSTEEARKKISTSAFDIILLDLFMPEMNGLQFAKKFGKEMPQTKIILLIEDQDISKLSSGPHSRLNFPAIPKSLVSRNLPELLSEDPSSTKPLEDGGGNGGLNGGAQWAA